MSTVPEDDNIPSISKSPAPASSENFYDEEKKEQLLRAIQYLHADNALLEAAELGDNVRLEELIKLVIS